MINFKLKILAVMFFIIVFANVNVFADSSNKVNEVVYVDEGEFNDKVSIKIMPMDGLKMDDTIFITIENAEFYSDLIDYQYKALGQENTYDSLKTKYEDLKEEYPESYNKLEQVFRDVFESIMIQYNSVELPYKINVIDKNTFEVKLFELPDGYAGQKFAYIGKPVYAIPLPFTNAKKGDITVKIDSNSTTVRGGLSYNIAVCSEKQPDEFYYGDADGNNVVDINDASVLLKKVLNHNYVLPIENMTMDFMKYVDLDGDGVLTAKDVALVLKKAIGNL